MPLRLTPLHPLFVAEATGIELRDCHDPAELAAIRRAMDAHAVLVFRDQRLSPAEQLCFADGLAGRIHRGPSAAAVAKRRHGDDGLTDIGNVGDDGRLLAAQDRRRMNGLANRLWHTDASFVEPCGRYSMLAARVVP